MNTRSDFCDWKVGYQGWPWYLQFNVPHGTLFEMELFKITSVNWHLL